MKRCFPPWLQNRGQALARIFEEINIVSHPVYICFVYFGKIVSVSPWLSWDALQEYEVPRPLPPVIQLCSWISEASLTVGTGLHQLCALPQIGLFMDKVSSVSRIASLLFFPPMLWSCWLNWTVTDTAQRTDLHPGKQFF